MQNTQVHHEIFKDSEIENTIDRILIDHDIKLNDLILLLKSQEIQRLGLVGNSIRESMYGKNVTFINNIILNYTNVCVTYCKFCAFYRPPGHEESYTVSKEEILVDEVKDVISPLKISSQTWLNIMEKAHSLGMKSSATMMYGTVESVEQRARHILKIADLQRKTGGFMAFIPWSFEPNKTEIQDSGLVQHPMGGFELLKMISVSRIVFNGLIDHLQSSWLTNGIGMAQLAIYHGSDDFGGTLIGEEVVSATGARSTELLSNNIITAIKAMGYTPAERNNSYDIVKHF